MKALCMVAHPDDCVIFGLSLIHNTPQLEWSICYLTYRDRDARAQEFAYYWRQRGIPCLFLGFEDDWRDIEAGRPSFDTHAAQNAIRDVCMFADVIATHDEHGDYGHPHHCFVNNCVRMLSHGDVITFAGPGRGTHQFTVDPVDYDQSCLPLHWEVIHGFHPALHRNEYNIMPDTASKIGL